MEQRFWAKVNQGAETECWDWTGTKDSYGYGVLKENGKSRKAHRIAWELTHGDIPESLIVRHRCRGKCVNPAHLELGTFGENAKDRVRDKTSRGEANGYARYTEAQVREFKDAFAQGKTPREVAAETGVPHQTLYSIKSGRTWGWV